ncbi:PPE family protein [Mycobacterium lacus]|uniref:PPE family protein n=1 Tax=Mycobacterium lacus TaxID=169765 RepID=A0A1X1YCY6_9MYCO|nr:PPE family protein [Mycobacterium lacus]MCV7123951.1 PPE family protein [Mycobacterium lacus]ORW08906.1 hypothetical protein AWC15_18515 [Mycobacterium lacus]BBX94835.1 PPE family protein [Mycobacterium lacus]
MDFGSLPPEINSGRMYLGPGSGPLLAAAAAWDALAAGLHATAAAYGSTIQQLTAGPWTGPSSVTMAAAAAPYVAWISATAAQAEQAATRAKVAAQAYETAYAGTVPPPVIAANRALLLSLIATNIFGQKAPAIAETEAQYTQMWAQDAAAMYAYAGSSAAASQLTPFTEPPQTTNPSAVGAQSAAVGQAAGGAATSDVTTQLAQVISVIPNALQGMATATTSPAATLLPVFNLPALPPQLATNVSNWNRILGALTGPYSIQLTVLPSAAFFYTGLFYTSAQNAQGLQSFFTPAKPIGGGLAPIAGSLGANLASSAVGGAPVSGGLGRAALVGSLSVPQSWTTAAPTLKTLASLLHTNFAAAPAATMSGEAGVFSQMALSSLAGRTVATSAFGPGAGRAASSLGGVAAEADPSAATIIVLPGIED